MDFSLSTSPLFVNVMIYIYIYVQYIHIVTISDTSFMPLLEAQ